MADTAASTSSVARAEAVAAVGAAAASAVRSTPAAPATGRRSLRGGRWPIPVLLLLCIPVFFWNLGNYGLVNGDEGFYHRIAQNMVLSSDWLTVQWNGELRVYETFMNSPLQHWMRAALITVGGYNYWTMRLLSALAGSLAVVFTYRLARQFMTAAESFLAAVLLMVSYQFVFLHGARTGELDAIITFIFVWLAYSFVRALRHNTSFVPHHLALLALIDIKLPVILMPLLFEAAYFLITPQHRRHIKRWTLTLLCLGPFFIVWHVYQLFDLGPRPVFTVLNLMADQASGDELQPTRHSAPGGFWEGLAENARFYWRNLMYGGFPYIVFAPLALLSVWRGQRSPRTRDFLKIVVLALAAVLIFYCVVSRRFPWYVIPAYPFAAILTARFLYRMEHLGRGVLATTGTALLAACALLITFRPHEPNPFEARAMTFSPKPSFREIGNLQTWAAVMLVGLAVFGVIYLIRWLTRHQDPRRVRVVPLMMILTLVICGGLRIGQGLQYTTHFTHMELFAQRLATKVERNRELEFPMDVPLSGAQNLARYHFGDDYVIATTGGDVRLARPLRPGEKPSMKREDLKARMSLSPLGDRSKKKK